MVTTFSRKLWEQYAERCIGSWVEHFPGAMPVWVYYGDEPIHEQERTAKAPWPLSWRFIDPNDHAPYRDFMAKHTQQDLPDYRKDARRFAHKVFAMAHAAEYCKTDYLVWLDADVYAFEDIPDDFFSSLFDGHYIFYLGRPMYSHPECGCFGYGTRHPSHPSFPQALADLYSSGKVFELKEQHDSWVWGKLREQCEQQGRFTSNNISTAPSGHAWLASPLAQYFDHMKGRRWQTQKSWREDVSALTQKGVRLNLTHPYWQHLPSREEV